MKQTLFRSVLLLMVLLAAVLPVWPAASVQAATYPLAASDARILAALNYLRNYSETDDPAMWAGGEKTCYAIVAIDACGADPHTFRNTAGQSLVDIIREKASFYLQPTPSASLAHEFYLMAIVAAGENPWDFAGINVVGQLLDMFNGTQIGQTGIVNDDFWAIIALTGAGVSPSRSEIQAMRQFIISEQGANGGWGSSVGGGGMGAAGDPCDTANAIMALIAAGESPSSTVIQQAFSFLHEWQNNDGGFPYYEGVSVSDVASDARVMAAIRACGGNPTGSEWTINGNNPFSHALSLQNDDGGFAWTAGGPTDAWMTTYIMPALVGKFWPTRITGDYAGPVVSAVNPPQGAVLSTPPSLISAGYTDAVSGVDVDSIQLTVNAQDVTAQAQITASGLTYTPYPELDDGTYQLKLTLADLAGNTTVYSWSFTVNSDYSSDTTAPAIVIISPADGEVVTTATPEISATYIDNLSGIDTSFIRLTINGVDVTAACSISATLLTYSPLAAIGEGTVTVRLTLRDMAGNTAYPTWEFTIDLSGQSTPDEPDDTVDPGTDTPDPSSGDDGSPATTSLTGKIDNDGAITETVKLTSRDGRLTVILAAGVTARNGETAPLESVTITTCATPPAIPDDLLPIGSAYQVGPGGATFSQPITITLDYDETQVNPKLKAWDVNCDGIIDALDIVQVQTEAWAGKSTSDFVIAGYNDATGQWECLTSTLNPYEKTLIATATNLTYFTLVCPLALPAGNTEGNIAEVSSTNLTGKIDASGTATEDIVLESTDLKKRLEIPQGTTITDSQGRPLEGIVLTENATTPAPADGYCRIGTAVELGPDGTSFGQLVILTFTYDESSSRELLRWDTNGDGTVDFLDKDSVVAPEDFRIACYDTATNAWVFLESSVDRTARTVSAPVCHFSLYALMAPVTEPLVVQKVSINPATVDLGEEVTITVTAVNPGDHRGTYMIPLEIDGVLEMSREVTLTPGESQITFTHQEPYTGAHEVAVLGPTGEFTVNQAAASGGNWWDSVDIVFYLYVIIGVLCAAIIAGIIILARIRRRRAG